MPVSTRSQISTENESTPTATQQRLRNPHHGLKEKLKTLTLLYEQQKQASATLRNSQVMRENTMPNSTITTTFVLPHVLPQPPSRNNEDSKENYNITFVPDRIVGFSCPKKTTSTTTATTTTTAETVSISSSATVARKLSMGTSKGNAEELEKIGSRIQVFVRVRPMNKKETEAGSRCCVKIVNRRDVYLTEFANENDYLRLNRIKGRHFTFDASFSDSATQQQVYSTTLVSSSFFHFFNFQIFNLFSIICTFYLLILINIESKNIII